MPFDADFLTRAKQYLGIGGDDPSSSNMPTPMPNAPTPYSLMQQSAPPMGMADSMMARSSDAPAPMGMGDSLAMRSGDAGMPTPPMGMAESLSARSGDKDMPSTDEEESDDEEDATGAKKATSAPPSALQNILKGGKTLDFTGDTLNTVSALQGAQDDRKKMQEYAMLARGINTLGTGLGGLVGGGAQGHLQAPLKEDGALEGQIKGLEGRADQNLKDFQAKAEKEKDDPGSSYSKGMRDFLKENYGIEAKGASATQLEKTLPWVVKSYEMAENRKARSEDLALKMSTLAEAKKANLLEKQRQEKEKDEKDAEKGATRFAQSINSEKSSGRMAFGKAAMTKQTIENVQALLKGETDYNNFSPQQAFEVSKVLDRVLSGGSGSTVRGTEELNEKTAKKWLADKMQYITSKRQGAGAGDFIANNAKTLQRELENSNEQILDTQKAMLAGSLSQAQKYPSFYNPILQNAGMPTVEEFNQAIEEKEKNRKQKLSSSSSSNTNNSFPKQVVNKKGQTATVSNQAEADEAKKEGFN